jgi:hypothetical protein
MWSFLSSLFRSVSLALMLLFLAPFILILILFSVVLGKDEAHFSRWRDASETLHPSTLTPCKHEPMRQFAPLYVSQRNTRVEGSLFLGWFYGQSERATSLCGRYFRNRICGGAAAKNG